MPVYGIDDYQISDTAGIAIHKVRGAGAGSLWGKTWYVNSSNSHAADGHGAGFTPDRPFATLAHALTRCIAGRDDTILLGPGHSETITSDTGCVLSLTGLRIIGMGRGTLRPKIQFGTSTAAIISVTASGCSIENVTLESDIASLVTMIGVGAVEGFTARNCVFQPGAGSFITGVTISSASAVDTSLVNCDFRGAASSTVQDACVSIAAACNRTRIHGCVMQGDWNTACIKSASIHTNCLITWNLIQNAEASEHQIEFTAAATGLIAHNAVGHNQAGAAGGAATIIDSGSCLCVQNFAADADADTSGVLTPPAT